MRVCYSSRGRGISVRGRMTVRKTLFAVAAVVLCLGSMLAGQQRSHAGASAKVARGKYLVESIGACADCHTPRDEKGEFVKEQWLQGATLDFKPTVPMPVWAEKSANIAGLPGWEKDAAIRFFMTGIGFNGLPPRPPMPQLRYNQQDAEAIVAYLQSLEPGKK